METPNIEQQQILTPAGLRLALRQFTGTEHYHKHPVIPDMALTDGAKCFADMTGSWALMVKIGLDFLPTCIDSPLYDGFALIRITIGRQGAGMIEVTDGNSNMIAKDGLAFSSIPEGEWLLYLEQADTDLHVLLLPSEH